MKSAALALFVFVSGALAQAASDYETARDAGHAALEQKDYVTAERELHKALELEPTAGQVSYWLGVSILGGRTLERMPEAIYQLARALVTNNGADVLSADDQGAADAYLKRAYDRFHGSTDGLDELKELARQSPFPPPKFRISMFLGEMSGSDPPSNPDVVLWRTMRDAVLRDGGVRYFEDIQGALIPPRDGRFKMFRGTVVRSASPSELLVIVDSLDNLVGDALLRFEAPITPAVAPGTKLEFRGIIESFSNPPYVLTLHLSPSDFVLK